MCDGGVFSVLIARLMKVGGSWGVSQRWCDCVTYCRTDRKASGKQALLLSSGSFFTWNWADYSAWGSFKSMLFILGFFFCIFVSLGLEICYFLSVKTISCHVLFTEVELLRHNKTWQTVSTCCVSWFFKQIHCVDDQFNQLAVFFKARILRAQLLHCEDLLVFCVFLHYSWVMNCWFDQTKHLIRNLPACFPQGRSQYRFLVIKETDNWYLEPMFILVFPFSYLLRVTLHIQTHSVSLLSLVARLVVGGTLSEATKNYFFVSEIGRRKHSYE